MAYDASKSEQIKNEMQQKVINLAENFQRNPQEIAEYLKFSTRFYNYSNRNTMLIYQQNPGATFCNSYKAYQDICNYFSSMYFRYYNCISVPDYFRQK